MKHKIYESCDLNELFAGAFVGGVDYDEEYPNAIHITIEYGKPLIPETLKQIVNCRGKIVRSEYDANGDHPNCFLETEMFSSQNLLARLSNLAVGETIEVSKHDLDSNIIDTVGVYVDGSFRPGQWRRTNDNPDFYVRIKTDSPIMLFCSAEET